MNRSMTAVQAASGPPLVLRQRYWSEKIASVLFLAPAVLFLLLTSVYPLFYSLWLSFHKWNMTIPRSHPVWFGFKNYQNLWHSDTFKNSLQVTLIFVVFSVAIEFLLGMGLALLATSNLKGMGAIRTVMLF